MIKTAPAVKPHRRGAITWGSYQRLQKRGRETEDDMDDKKERVMTIDTIDRQRKYVDAQKQKGHGLGVVFADAFLRGMRDLGHKNPAWAIADEVDNSFQAAA